MLIGLKRPTISTLLLWLFALACGVALGLSGDAGQLPSHAEWMATLTLPLLIGLWVVNDARIRQRRLCCDFDTFVFFGWWLADPVYLFQTRGFRAFLTLLGFACLCVAAWLVASAMSLLAGGS